MGEWMVRKSIKFPAWMLERLAVEKDRFAPFCENESDVIRLLLRIVFRCIDAGMLAQITEGLQGALRHTSCAHCGTQNFLAIAPGTASEAVVECEPLRPRSADRLNRRRSRRGVVVLGTEPLRFLPFRAFGLLSPERSLA